MCKPVFSVIGALAAVLTALPAPAQTGAGGGSGIRLEQAGTTNWNRFGLSGRMGFNLSAHFKNPGGYSGRTPLANPLRTPGNRDGYNYDNGYVYEDNVPPSGYTHYYGYVAGTAVRGTEFDLYRSSYSANLTSSDGNNGPQYGFELNYNRQLGRVWRGYWGCEAGLGFMNVSVHDDRSFQGTVTRTTDTFRTGGGAVLQSAPQAFPYEGPAPDSPGWPLVGLSPVHSASDLFAGGATVAGHREFDAQMVSLRVGPYLEMPVSDRWAFSLSAGLVLLQVFSDFKYVDTLSFNPAATRATLPSETHRGSGSHDDLLVGGYVAGNLRCALSRDWSVSGGVQVQDAGTYSHSEGGKTAVLDLGRTVFVSLGVNYSF